MTESIRRSVLPLVLMVAGAVWAQSPSMSLGDVVKQPKPVRKAARVITDEDLPPRSPSAAAESGSAAPEQEDVDAKTKSAASAAPQNQLLAQRIADLKDAEGAEEQLTRKIEQKLNDETEPLSAPQRQSYLNALKQSKMTLYSYQQQRTTLEEIAAKPEPEEEKAEEKTPEAKPAKPAEKSPAASPATAPQETPKAAE